MNKKIHPKLYMLMAIGLVLICLILLYTNADSHKTLSNYFEITWNKKTSSPVISTVFSSGREWMDRNLGASQVATSSTDPAAYGDLYQWGREPDGHQNRSSARIDFQSAKDSPGHNKFIVGYSDWLSSKKGNLWQGSKTNNPCPPSFRIPTEKEWEDEMKTWSSNSEEGAFSSPLKLVTAGYRRQDNNIISLAYSKVGYYWSSTTNANYARFLYFHSGEAGLESTHRGNGLSVRCIKD